MVNIKLIIELIYKCINSFTNNQQIFTIIIFAICWMGLLSMFLVIILVIIYLLLKLFTIIKKCRYKLFNKIKLIEEIEEKCSICLEDVRGKCYITSCNHTFHKECLSRYIDKKIENFESFNIKCPNCRNKKLLYMV